MNTRESIQQIAAAMNAAIIGKETGAQNLTWVLPAITKRVVAFQKTLQDEPPIKLGTPEPYTPAN